MDSRWSSRVEYGTTRILNWQPSWSGAYLWRGWCPGFEWKEVYRVHIHRQVAHSRVGAYRLLMEGRLMLRRHFHLASTVLGLLLWSCAPHATHRAHGTKAASSTEGGLEEQSRQVLYARSMPPAREVAISDQSTGLDTPPHSTSTPMRLSPTPQPNSMASSTLETFATETCPATAPPEPFFIPPLPWPKKSPEDEFWYGTNELWTALQEDGTWVDLPFYDGHYTQKVFWWREGYSWTEEPQPDLTVVGRRLDASAPALEASRVTNAFAPDIRSAMLVGVGIPTHGCWEITGSYKGHELSFVVWVAP